MKKKRMYRQPAQQVVELQVKNQLLAGSTTGEREDYGEGGNEEWD